MCYSKSEQNTAEQEILLGFQDRNNLCDKNVCMLDFRV